MRGARSIRRSAALAAVLAVGLLAPGTPAQAVLPQGNLILNGDGEVGAAAGDEVFKRCAPEWNCYAPDNPTLVRYGTTTFPTRGESARIGGGKSFFAGGPDIERASAAMSAELAAAAVEIDAGAAAATLSACLGGWQHQDDYAQLTLQFFTEPEAGGSFFPAQQVIGPKAAARGNKTKLLPVAKTVQVPPGARSAVILLTAQRVRGLYNDGYADNLSLTLGPSPGPAPPASSCLAPAGGTSSGAGAVTNVLSIGKSARIGADGRARISVTCNSRHVKRCAGKVSVSLVRGATSSARRRRGTTRYSIASLKKRTIKVTLRRSDARRVRRLSRRQLSKRRLKVRTTTTVGSAKVKQTSLVVVRRR